jgi:type IV secretion system T-DNA border endonuclease VirD2
MITSRYDDEINELLSGSLLKKEEQQKPQGRSGGGARGAIGGAAIAGILSKLGMTRIGSASALKASVGLGGAKGVMRAGGRKATGGGLARLQRVMAGAPEVMVKVTFQHNGRAAVLKHMTYITRNGSIEMENELGEAFTDKRDLHEVLDVWDVQYLEEKENAEIKDTVNIVYGMPADMDDDAVRDAVRATLKQTVANHRFIFALHSPKTDPGKDGSKHPHVHVVIQKTGVNGKRLRHGPQELASWRECFAQELRARGIEAEATRRYARGQFKKAERQPILEMKKRGVTPKVFTGEIDGRAIKARNKDSAMSKFMDVQKKLHTLAERMKTEGTPEEQKIGRQLAAFVTQRPDMKLQDKKIGPTGPTQTL